MKDQAHGGTIAFVAVAVGLFVVGAIGLRIWVRPLTTIGVGAAIDVALACAEPAAEHDRARIAARFELLRIDALVELVDGQHLRLRATEDPGPEVLEALLARNELAVHEVLDRRGPGTIALPDASGEGAELVVRTPPAIRAAEVASAQVVVDPATDQPRISIALTPDGARSFEALTGSAIGRRIAIAIDGRVLTAPVVRERISGGMASVTLGGDPTTELARARGLATALSTDPLACAWAIERR